MVTTKDAPIVIGVPIFLAAKALNIEWLYNQRFNADLAAVSQRKTCYQKEIPSFNYFTSLQGQAG